MIEFETDKGTLPEEGNCLWTEQVEKAFGEMFEQSDMKLCDPIVPNDVDE